MPFFAWNSLPSTLLVNATLVVILGSLLSSVYHRVGLYYSTRHLPGPPISSFLIGNLKEILADEKASVANKWLEKYGRVFKIWVLFGSQEVYLTDLKAMNHVLNNPDIYEKPDHVRYMLGRITGQGLLVKEGEEHRKQRRVKNLAFGPAQIRALTGIFIDKSIALRDVWATMVNQDTSAGRVDALSWLSRMTLDVIGQAGFNYQLDALSGNPNELNTAFARIFKTGDVLPVPVLLKLLFPILRNLPDHEASFRQAIATSTRIAKDLFAQSRIAAQSEKPSDLERDLLTVLVRSNLSSDLSEGQRLSDDDVLAQVPTFLAAGHETTSTATTWSLYLLSTNPRVQAKLREEVSSHPNGFPSMDKLNGLQYLDCVVRETLRLFAPVPATVREATRDDVIRLSESFVDVHGKEHWEFKVKKGQQITIPILMLNKAKFWWGEDAEEFQPERWEDPPEAITSMPGVWGNMMTFLGGPHACIGWRFSIVEMKALLFTLIRAYEFELAVPKEDVLVKRAFPINRPALRGSKEDELPMIIRPVV
ncbi:cytochrome P450 [Marasmius fiardii PR-910]|nr:cytochrome P450 [Marasmius fiardii PR-910]